MVTPYELRLNNWILGRTKKPLKVVAIRGWLIDAETSFGFKTVEPRYLEGIPLTEDILERAGFQYSIENLRWTLKAKRCSLILNEDFFAILHDECVGAKLTVHRLQNLFEALTCEELNINLF